MLKEIKSQQLDKKDRIWFSDADCDLIVWGQPRLIRGFQLCYDKRGVERAVTWYAENGFTHERIDDGEADPGKNRTPLLVPDGCCPVNELLENFLSRSIDIDEELRSFISGKLREYSSMLKGKIEAE